MTAAPSGTQGMCSTPSAPRTSAAYSGAESYGSSPTRTMRTSGAPARIAGAAWMRSSGPLRGSMRPTKPTTGARRGGVGIGRPRGGHVGHVELDGAVDDVGGQVGEPRRDRARVGEHGVGARPEARHAVDDVVHVQDRAPAGEAGQQAAADGAVEVDEVVVGGEAAGAREARRGAGAGAALEAAERQADDRQAGVVERAGGGRGERERVAAREQPLGQPEQADLGAAGVGDGTYREDPHPAILAGRGPLRDLAVGACSPALTAVQGLALGAQRELFDTPASRSPSGGMSTHLCQPLFASRSSVSVALVVGGVVRTLAGLASSAT